MFFVMYNRLMRTNHFLLHAGYSIVSRISISAVILIPDLSNFADLRQLQIPNAQTKHYKITETPRNTSHKIANWHIESKYNLSTLQNKNSNYFLTRVHMSSSDVRDYNHSQMTGSHIWQSFRSRSVIHLSYLCEMSTPDPRKCQPIDCQICISLKL